MPEVVGSSCASQTSGCGVITAGHDRLARKNSGIEVATMYWKARSRVRKKLPTNRPKATVTATNKVPPSSWPIGLPPRG